MLRPTPLFLTACACAALLLASGAGPAHAACSLPVDADGVSPPPDRIATVLSLIFNPPPPAEPAPDAETPSDDRPGTAARRERNTGIALLDAAIRDDGATASLLLEWDVDPNPVDGCGMTPVGHAAARGHTGMLGLLLTFDADTETGPGGVTPLMLAAESGHLPASILLLDHGANANAVSDGGDTPLLAAARRGDLRIVRELLERGADPNHAGPDGTTPLMWSALQGHTRIARLLLRKGADPQMADQQGATAESLARVQGHVPILSLLGAALEKLPLPEEPVSPDLEPAAPEEPVRVARVETRRPATPPPPEPAPTSAPAPKISPEPALAEPPRAATSPTSPETAARAANVSGVPFPTAPQAVTTPRTEKPEPEGTSVLIRGTTTVPEAPIQASMVAEEEGTPALPVREAAGSRTGPEPPAADAAPLLAAATAGDTGTVRDLLKAGTPVDARGDHGETALHRAAANGEHRTVKFLLEMGAAPNLQDDDGATALLRAASAGHHKVVKALLKGGADPHLSDGFGRTAMDAARQGGHEKVIRVLERNE